MKAIIFDLDGVICFTNEYHCLACLGDAAQAGAGDWNMGSFAELLDICK